MGVSVSASALIFFISFAICLSMVFTATQAYYEDIQEAQSASAQNIEKTINTAVRLDRAAYNGTTGILLVNATNTGSVTLDPNLIDLFVDGVLKTGNITSLVSGGVEGGMWYPAMTLTVSLKGISSPSRIKLSAPNGAGCYTEDIIISA